MLCMANFPNWMQRGQWKTSFTATDGGSVIWWKRPVDVKRRHLRLVAMPDALPASNAERFRTSLRVNESATRLRFTNKCSVDEGMHEWTRLWNTWKHSTKHTASYDERCYFKMAVHGCWMKMRQWPLKCICMAQPEVVLFSYWGFLQIAAGPWPVLCQICTDRSRVSWKMGKSMRLIWELSSHLRHNAHHSPFIQHTQWVYQGIVACCGLCLWTAKFQFETPATNTTQSTGLFRHGATLTSLAFQMTSSFIVAKEMNSGGHLVCEWINEKWTHTTPHQMTWRMPVELHVKSHVWVVYHRTCMINRDHTPLH